jgi:hypothetical protein
MINGELPSQLRQIEQYKKDAKYCVIVWFDLQGARDNPSTILHYTFQDAQSNGGIKDYHFEIIKEAGNEHI